MSFRLKWILSAPLLAVLASACTDDVTQEEAGTFLRGTFDSTRGLIPTPNDLALQAAMLQPAGATRTALQGVITAGGFPGGAPNALNLINVPFELVADGVATTARTWHDPASINSTTVAIVKVRGTGAPDLVDPDPTLAPTGISAIRAFPAGGWEAGARYVVAVRGGPSGVRTIDGQTLAASAPVYLLTHGVDLSSPETRPSSLTPQQAADLQTVQRLLANPVDWGRVDNANAPGGQGAATCAAITGAPAAAFAEAQCWLPLVSAQVPGFPGDPPTRSALAAVSELAWPVTEAISIQTFEIAP